MGEPDASPSSIMERVHRRDSRNVSTPQVRINMDSQPRFFLATALPNISWASWKHNRHSAFGIFLKTFLLEPFLLK